MSDPHFEEPRVKNIGDYAREAVEKRKRLKKMGVEYFHLSKEESEIISGHVLDAFERGMYDPDEEMFLNKLISEILRDGSRDYEVEITIRVTDKKKYEESRQNDEFI